MGFATAADVIAALPGQNPAQYKFSGGVSSITGTLVSHWLGTPNVGVTPPTGAGAVPTLATVGALPLKAAGAGNQLYIAQALLGASSSQGAIIVYDRLVHTSGLSGIVATAQTVNSAALTRYTSGAGNELWLEWYTATGATAANVTASYTNQAGTAGRTTPSIAVPTSMALGHILPLPLQAGDTGVRSVQSVTLSVSTGTAGNFGVTIAHRLTTIMTGSSPVQSDPLYTGLAAVDNAACLAFAAFQAQSVIGSLSIIEGPQ